MNDFKKYKCPICGIMSIFDDNCDGCWNVERNIEDYLKYNKGKEKMFFYLNSSGANKYIEEKINEIKKVNHVKVETKLITLESSKTKRIDVLLNEILEYIKGKL